MTQAAGKVFKSKDTVSREELAELLATLAERIRTGSVTLGSGDASNQMELHLPESVTLELQVEDSNKRTGTEREFELEMKWRVDAKGNPEAQQRPDRGFTIS